MTNLLYLDDTYRMSAETRLVRIDEDERGPYCVFEDTLFYPQGGGQPSDRGRVQCAGQSFQISHVALFGDEVRHYGDVSGISPHTAERCALWVDEERRLSGARAHTAGHLIQSVVDGLRTGLVAVKGYHFPEGPYVEFQGAADVGREELVQLIDERSAELIREGRRLTARRASASDPDIAELLTHMPYRVPADKPLRVVQIEGYSPVPCGGTHLRALDELGAVRVRKIKLKGSSTQVGYTCEPFRN